MALIIQPIPIGQNFDGTPSQGEVVLYDQDDDDTQRAELLSVSIQSGETSTSLIVKIAPSLADATTPGGVFAQLGIVEDDTGLNMTCCRCIVPRNWRLYAFTSGPVTVAKTLVVDWHRVTMLGDA